MFEIDRRSSSLDFWTPVPNLWGQKATNVHGGVFLTQIFVFFNNSPFWRIRVLQADKQLAIM